MTATERLRAMLDERGVEWETDGSGFRVMWGQPVSIDQMQFKAVDNALPNGGLNISICGFTPQQAIAATLGAGTCHIECNESGCNFAYRLWTLSCGHTVWTMGDAPNYCQTCGKKVER